MATRKVKLEVTVEYDGENTDEDEVSEAMGILMANATSTPGLLDDHGICSVGDFEVAMFIPPDAKW